MKNTYCFILLALLIAMVTNTARALDFQSTTNVLKTENVTNINQAIVSILMGTKNVGGEVFNASKEAIVNSIDFMQKEAPDVLKQFLKWHFIENLLYYVIWLLIIPVLFIFSWKIKQSFILDQREDVYRHFWDEGVYNFVQYLIACVCVGIFIIDTCNYGKEALKVYLVPKVYLLDYVMSIVQNH